MNTPFSKFDNSVIIGPSYPISYPCQLKTQRIASLGSNPASVLTQVSVAIVFFFEYAKMPFCFKTLVKFKGRYLWPDF